MSELERFFQFLQILLAQVNCEWRGRPSHRRRAFRYDHGLILKLLILQAASNWSLRTLDRKLRALRNTLYRRLVGVRRSELPTQDDRSPPLEESPLPPLPATGPPLPSPEQGGDPPLPW